MPLNQTDLGALRILHYRDFYQEGYSSTGWHIDSDIYGRVQLGVSPEHYLAWDTMHLIPTMEQRLAATDTMTADIQQEFEYHLTIARTPLNEMAINANNSQEYVINVARRLSMETLMHRSAASHEDLVAGIAKGLKYAEIILSADAIKPTRVKNPSTNGQLTRNAFVLGASALIDKGFNFINERISRFIAYNRIQLPPGKTYDRNDVDKIITDVKSRFGNQAVADTVELLSTAHHAFTPEALERIAWHQGQIKAQSNTTTFPVTVEKASQLLRLSPEQIDIVQAVEKASADRSPTSPHHDKGKAPAMTTISANHTSTNKPTEPNQEAASQKTNLQTNQTADHSQQEVDTVGLIIAKQSKQHDKNEKKPNSSFRSYLDAEKIQTLRETFDVFTNLGALTNNSHFVRIGTIGGAALTVTNSLKTLTAKGAGTLSARAVLNHVNLILGAFSTIAGLFSNKNGMASALQAISRQIADLHRDMHTLFEKTFKQLMAIQQQIAHAQATASLIRDDVETLRKEIKTQAIKSVLDRVTELCNQLERSDINAEERFTCLKNILDKELPDPGYDKEVKAGHYLYWYPVIEYARQLQAPAISTLAQPSLLLIPMPADGNCLFHALAHQRQLKHPQELLSATEMRRRIVDEIRNNTTIYQDFIPEDSRQYPERMASPSTWGDQLEIKAAARLFNSCIKVHRTGQTELTHGENANNNDAEIWHLFYNGENHYDSLAPADLLSRSLLPSIGSFWHISLKSYLNARLPESGVSLFHEMMSDRIKALDTVLISKLQGMQIHIAYLQSGHVHQLFIQTSQVLFQELCRRLLLRDIEHKYNALATAVELACEDINHKTNDNGKGKKWDYYESEYYPAAEEFIQKHRVPEKHVAFLEALKLFKTYFPDHPVLTKRLQEAALSEQLFLDKVNQHLERIKQLLAINPALSHLVEELEHYQILHLRLNATDIQHLLPTGQHGRTLGEIVQAYHTLPNPYLVLHALFRHSHLFKGNIHFKQHPGVQVGLGSLQGVLLGQFSDTQRKHYQELLSSLAASVQPNYQATLKVLNTSEHHRIILRDLSAAGPGAERLTLLKIYRDMEMMNNLIQAAINNPYLQQLQMDLALQIQQLLRPISHYSFVTMPQQAEFIQQWTSLGISTKQKIYLQVIMELERRGAREASKQLRQLFDLGGVFNIKLDPPPQAGPGYEQWAKTQIENIRTGLHDCLIELSTMQMPSSERSIIQNFQEQLMPVLKQIMQTHNQIEQAIVRRASVEPALIDTLMDRLQRQLAAPANSISAQQPSAAQLLAHNGLFANPANLQAPAPEQVGRSISPKIV